MWGKESAAEWVDAIYAELVRIVPGGEEGLLGEERSAVTALCTNTTRAVAICNVSNAGGVVQRCG